MSENRPKKKLKFNIYRLPALIFTVLALIPFFGIGLFFATFDIEGDAFPMLILLGLFWGLPGLFLFAMIKSAFVPEDECYTGSIVKRIEEIVHNPQTDISKESVISDAPSQEQVFEAPRVTMLFCQSCGEVLREGATCCPLCGVSVKD